MNSPHSKLWGSGWLHYIPPIKRRTSYGDSSLQQATGNSELNEIITTPVITAVLPANGFARIFSGITCKDMVQVSTIGRLSETALNNLKSCITHTGEQAGPPHHVEAANCRFEK